MNSWTNGNLCDQFSIWIVNVLLQAAVVSAVALTISLALRRTAALRYGVLSAGLVLVLLTSLTAGAMQMSARNWFPLSVMHVAVKPVSDPDAVTPATEPLAASAWPARSEELNRTSGLIRDDREPFSDEPFDVADARESGSRAVADEPFHNAEAVTSSGSQGNSSNPLTIGFGATLRLATLVLLTIWLTGSAILLAKLAISYACLGRILGAARPNEDAAIEESFAQAGRALQLEELPELVLSDRVSGPFSAGLIRPRIVLPERMVDRVTPRQLRDIFLHEVAHVVRRDHAIVMLQNIAAALFWLHPLVKVLNRQLSQAREEVCDNYVLAATDAPSYSRTLLMLAQLVRSAGPLPGAVGLFTSRWKLESRVAGLLDERRSRGTHLTWRGWAFVCGIAVALSAVTAFGTISIAVEDDDGGQQGPTDLRAAAAAGQTVAPSDDGLLTLRLKVRMPDASPAAQAIVESSHQYPELDKTARADESGRVVIREEFGGGARVYARSADGAFQATLQVMAHEVRGAFEHALQLTLAPAVEYQVVVVAEGRPAADVQVVVAGHRFKSFGKTGPDGVATLKLPADDTVNQVVAWHSQRGVAGIRDLSNGLVAQGSTRLALLAPSPLTVRIVDPQGDPVPGLELRASFATEDSKDFIIAGDVPATQVRTNQEGEAVVPWAPRDRLQFVDVDIIGATWKEDEIDSAQLSQRIITVHVRPQKPVAGRLIMPAGASAEGILVTGFGFGPEERGCIPTVRARRDGRFTFDCPSGHAFVLGVFDREWAGTPWTGLILADDDDAQAEIAIPVRSAIPLRVRVTRGPDHVPDANAWIHLQQRGDVHWTDAHGKDQNAGGYVGGWLRADTNGVAHAGVARGKINFNVQSGKWFEERTLDVKSDEPVDVEFHRPWLGDRNVVARMTLDGVAYKPSASLEAKAWSVRKGFGGLPHQPIIRDDHAIEVRFDEENLALLVVDREKQLSGFARLGPETDFMELVMQPTATYSGTLLDENGEPLADRTLRLIAESSWLDVVEPQRTDDSGRFRFTGVAVNAPLRLNVNDEEGFPKYSPFGYDRIFEPGEVREATRLRCEAVIE